MINFCGTNTQTQRHRLMKQYLPVNLNSETLDLWIQVRINLTEKCLVEKELQVHWLFLPLGEAQTHVSFQLHIVFSKMHEYVCGCSLSFIRRNTAGRRCGSPQRLRHLRCLKYRTGSIIKVYIYSWSLRCEFAVTRHVKVAAAIPCHTSVSLVR